MRTPNRANFKLANKFSTEFLRQYIYSSTVTPNYLKDSEKFWYAWRDRNGWHYWMVDPAGKSKRPLFDHVKLAAQLSELSKKPVDAANLALSQMSITDDAKKLRFAVDNVRYEYELETQSLKVAPPAQRPPAAGAAAAAQGQQDQQQEQQQQEQQQGAQGFRGIPADFRNFSPDRKWYIYAKDHDLYYVDAAKPEEPLQISFDGERYYSFGSRAQRDEFLRQFQQQQQQQQRQQTTVTGAEIETDPNQFDAAQGQRGKRGGNRTEQGTVGTGAQRQGPPEERVRVQAIWAPDSSAFAITRSDQRKVADLFLVNALAEPRPSLMTYRYPMPGEEFVTQTELHVFRRDQMKLVKYDVGRWKDQRISDIHWTPSTDRIRFVRRDRLQRNLELCELHLDTQKVSVLLSESVENAFLEVQSVRYIKPGGDFIWWSERTGWGHYYLYSHDGRLKAPITSGPYRADGIVAVDADKGLFWFQGVGREPGENPYYQHLYRCTLDGRNLTLLDPGDANHTSTLSSKRGYLVDNFSRTDKANKAVVRDENGRQVMELEEMDLVRLKETGWRMPETFVVKAADGVTDIYGNMWKPFDFDPTRRYPIIANVYPGPQTESVTPGFQPTAAPQRLAQLGFIVIQIGNRGGNPKRSNAYHSYGYYNLRDYGLADKKAGIEQLASRHPWIDIDRVGIYGHSGGGFMTAAALLLPPYNEFFKVGVASAGNHDNNIYNQNWSEQHHGLKEVKGPKPPVGTAAAGNAGAVPPPDTSAQTAAAQTAQKSADTNETHFEIKVPTNQELAVNLKGRLLLVHGDMDNNVHPANTIRLVNALIKAGKRFDMMILPGQAHGFGSMQPYFNQMMFEYFAEHLLGDYYRDSAEMKVGGN
jgi:dipeptidyl aminopeptidase/acylaminoacyl peptidase